MSFAKEMSDFNTAFQNTTKTFDDSAYKKTLGDYYKSQTNDDEDDALDKEGKKLDNAAKAQRIAAGYQSMRLKTAASVTPADPTATGLASGAIPQGNAGALTAPDGSTPGYAAGGPVAPMQVQQQQQNLQDQATGAVGDPNDPTDSPMVHQQIVQQNQQGAVGDDSDDSDDDDTPSFSADARTDATLAGLKAMYGDTEARAIPAGYRGGRRGVAPMPLADMNQIYKVIDPKGKMSEAERNANALSAVWQYKLKQGDLNGAKQAAGAMLAHYHLNVQRYAAITAAAAQHGDINGAAKAAMKTYANIPDGKDLKLWVGQDGKTIQYSYTGEDGQTISHGVVPPDQLAAQAMNVATKGFVPFLEQAAGENLKKGGAQGAVGGGGGKPMKPTDRDTMMEDIKNEFDKQLVDDNGQPLKMSDEQARAVQGTALRILNDPQNQMMAGEAVNISKRMHSVNGKDANNPGFTSKPVDPDDLSQGYMLQTGKGPAFHVGQGDFDAAMETRLAQKAAADKKEAKDAEDAKKPGWLDDAKEVVGKYRDDVKSTPAKEAPPPGDQFAGGTRTGGDASGDSKFAIPDRPPADIEKPYVPFIAGGK